MFVLGNVLLGLAEVFRWILQIYMWVLVGRAIVSWVNADPYNPIVRFLRMATDPPVELVRRLLPSSLRYFPLDVAFLVVFGIVIFAQYAVVQTLVDLGQRLHTPVSTQGPCAGGPDVRL